MAESHIPIKVGTGLIEIIPKVTQKAKTELRSELEKLGVQSAKSVSKAVSTGLSGMPAEVKKQARKAKQGVEEEALDAKKRLKQIEKQLTKEYGEETAKRFKDFRRLELKKQELLEETSAETRKAIRDAVRLEEKSNRDRLTSAERLERERMKLQERARREHEKTEREKTRETQRQAQARERAERDSQRAAAAAQREALRQAVAAQRAATQEQVREIRRQAAEQRAAIMSQISGHQATMRTIRDGMAATRRDITTTSTTTSNFFKKTEGNLRKMGTWFDQVGTSISEAGAILSTKFLAPLAAAGAALTTIGVKSADTRILGQLGLNAAGVSTKVATAQMNSIQQYAIDTPFSIDVMHEYQMRLIRSMAGADKNWFSKDPTVKGAAADQAAMKTTDLIKAIGDSMARSGNLAPTEFTRAMYAIDKIMDRDRAPTRNITQLVNATGIPAAELANLLGFDDSEQMWKVVGTPANKGGGVTGTEIVNSLLKNWKGEAGRPGSQGYAEKATSATISGRLQQLKEQATFNIGNMFAKEDPKTGKYEYTGLGERLLGKKKTLYDNHDQVKGYTYEGGLLQQLEDMGHEYGPKIPKFLNMFFDGIQSFIDTIKKITGFINDHPVIVEAFKSISKFLIEWGPLILAVGLLSKVLGKAVGIFGRAMGPLSAVTRGAVNAYEGGRNLRSQRAARNEARQTAADAGLSRREQRQAGRDAYRNQRTQNRGGDSRGAGRRALDSFTGRDSNVRDQQRQMRDFEQQAREARDEIARLRDELREVNRASLQNINNAMGQGRTSLQGAANQAQNAVRNVVSQGTTPLNNANLNQVQSEFTQLEQAIDKVKAALNRAKDEVQHLDAANLNKVTGEVNHLKSAAEDAGKHITSANTRVGNLNGKDLKGVTGSMRDLTSEAKDAATQIGDGAMSKSVAGRTANLNKRRLTSIVDEFKKLTNAADGAHDKVGQGTGSTSLAGRIGLLNGRSLKKLTDAVDKLKKSLDNAKDEAENLDDALSNVEGRSPGSSGGSSGKGKGKSKKKHARGGVATMADVSRYGVMPGYQPWVDNIPAILSPGEAVLRPEVTSHLGEGTINAWNALAVRGKLSRHARGGVVGGKGKLNLESIKELIDLQNIAPIGSAAIQTMKLGSASNALGGGTQSGILGTGDISSRFLGGSAAGKFKGTYDWIASGVWDALKKVPTIVGQVAGILGGTIGPIQGEYFWNDVWKGKGNIVDRGEKYLGDIFSTKTLGKVWENLSGGVWDSITSIWDTGKAMVTDPIGTVQGAIGDVYDIVTGSYNNLVGMVDTVRDFKDAPMEYAGRVFNEFMTTAEESMPNTKGLFDFGQKERVSGKVPDVSGAMSSAPSGGSGAARWSGVARSAMGMLGIPDSYLSTILHRIQMESGGNPNIVNKWDSNWLAGHPSVGLMQVIGPTYGAYAGPFRKTGPFQYGTSVNPLANVYAGLNYAKQRYGSRWASVLAGNTGYATGTLSASPGLAMVGERGPELVNFRGGERVYTNQETEALLSGKKYEIHVHEARNEPTPQAVIRALQTAEALYTNM